MGSLKKLRELQFHKQSGRCVYCDQPMWLCDAKLFGDRYKLQLSTVRWFQATAEHLKAKSEGGKNELCNIAAACSYCNRHRHLSNKPLTPEDYTKKVRYRLHAGRWHGFIADR